MDVSAADRDLITRTVLAEAGPGASPAEQAAIAHVIVNRLNSGQHGTTARDVVLEPHQFEPWGLKRNAANHPTRFDPKSDAYGAASKVVDGVLNGATPDPTAGADHFLQPETVAGRVRSGKLAQWPSWAQGDGLRIGQHAFYASAKKQAGKPSKDDYKDLLEDEPPEPTQTAGEAAPTQSPKPEHYSDLLEGAPEEAKGKPAEDRSGLFGELPRQLQEHPVLAGAAAAAAVPLVIAGGAELGVGTLAGFAGRLLANRMVQMGVGSALGQQIGSHGADMWNYLAKVSGISEGSAP